VNVNKEPNHTTIELNDTERAFLFVILEMWAPEEHSSMFRDRKSPILQRFAVSLAKELAP